ncbi:MAG: cysteine--tRNA ligase [archaeon]
MALFLHNTMTRKLEEFTLPAGREIVLFYTCGPTVYNFAHIGNFRAYVCQDVLKRYLRYKGFQVNHVMNLTDVDDKTIRDSQKEGLPLSNFTEKYKKAFFEDCAVLGLDPADAYPEATKYIEEMLDIIQKLLEKGLAYKGEDGSIYYNVRNFPGYGKLSGIPLDSLRAGARVKSDEYSKEQANDFALWKAWSEEDGRIFWESPFGRGRPGWHIECSAMSMRTLGETIDIHAGGIDLIFPHHEDEIAQSEGATGKQFARYWVHNEYLLVDGKKMSKSLGNFYTLRDILAKGYSGREIRYLLLATHYRQPLNFTFPALDGARGAVGKLAEFVRNLKDVRHEGDSGIAGSFLEIAERKFENAMDSDLNTSEALAAIFELVRETNKLIGELGRSEAENILEALRKIDSVIGVLGPEFEGREEIPVRVGELVAEREAARAGKNWEAADRIRKEIESLGYSVQDSKDGSRIRKLIS